MNKASLAAGVVLTLAGLHFHHDGIITYGVIVCSLSIIGAIIQYLD